MGAFRVLLALALVLVGGWIIYSVITGVPLVPSFLGNPTSTTGDQKPPDTGTTGTTGKNPPTSPGTTTAPGTGIR